jgi:hypothetical protein
MAMAQGSLNFTVSARDAASKVIHTIGGNIKTMAKTAVASFAAFVGAVSAASATVVAFSKHAVHAAIEDSTAQEHMISLLKHRKLWTDKNKESIDKMTEAGAKLAFTQEDIRASIETATTFATKFSDAQKIVAASQDVARAKNISLAEATQIVSRGYMGMARGLKMMGVQIPKGATGLTVINEVLKKFGGSAIDFSKTFAGQMESAHDSINVTVKAIGYAIGGGAGMPTFVKLLNTLRPVLDDVLSTVKSYLPDLQKYSAQIANEIPVKVANLWATVKKALPDILSTVKSWIDKAFEFGYWVNDTLGPKGTVQVALAAIAFKIGGWKGAITGAFTTGFSSIGFDPLQSAIAGAITAAFASTVVEQGLEALGAKVAAAIFGGNAISAAASAATAGTAAAAGAGEVAAGVGLGALVIAALPEILAAGAVVAAVAALALLASKPQPERPLSETHPGVAAPSSILDPGYDWSNYMKDFESQFKGIRYQGGYGSDLHPQDVTVKSYLVLDGKQIAYTVGQYTDGKFARSDPGAR